MWRSRSGRSPCRSRRRRERGGSTRRSSGRRSFRSRSCRRRRRSGRRSRGFAVSCVTGCQSIRRISFRGRSVDVTTPTASSRCAARITGCTTRVSSVCCRTLDEDCGGSGRMRGFTCRRRGSHGRFGARDGADASVEAGRARLLPVVRTGSRSWSKQASGNEGGERDSESRQDCRRPPLTSVPLEKKCSKEPAEHCGERGPDEPSRRLAHLVICEQAPKKHGHTDRSRSVQPCGSRLASPVRVHVARLPPGSGFPCSGAGSRPLLLLVQSGSRGASMRRSDSCRQPHLLSVGWDASFRWWRNQNLIASMTTPSAIGNPATSAAVSLARASPRPASNDARRSSRRFRVRSAIAPRPKRESARCGAAASAHRRAPR